MNFLRIFKFFLFTVTFFCGFQKTLFGQLYSEVSNNITLIEQNRIENGKSMKPFFDKLVNIKKTGAKVSILHLGDSHMQMGYFIQEVREQLSELWGLSGYGTIFPYQLANYKPFYVSSKIITGKWSGNNYLTPEYEIKYGVTGFIAKTSDSVATLQIATKNCPKEIIGFDQVVVYYDAPNGTNLIIDGVNSIVDSSIFSRADTVVIAENTAAYKKGWKRKTFHFKSEMDRVLLTINKLPDTSKFILYGLQLDHADLPGIIYNNCAVGGAQFSHICNNASYALGQIEDLNPDLIILSYGSNDSYTTKFNGNLYHKMVGGFIDSLKLLLPKTNFILTSPPDTRSKDRFPRNVDSIQLVFHQLSQEKDIAYWDLRTQMGGNGSLYTWLKNGLAAKDKLHFTKTGYTLQAKLFINALINTNNELEEKKYTINPLKIVGKP